MTVMGYQEPPPLPDPPPPEKPPPLEKPLDPLDPGVLANVPAACVEKASMSAAMWENVFVPHDPTYQVGMATLWPAATAAWATSSKTCAQRSATPKTMA